MSEDRQNSIHQLRIVRDWKALSQKIRELETFIGSDTFFKLPKDEQDLFADQLGYMQGYRKCLLKRMQRLAANPKGPLNFEEFDGFWKVDDEQAEEGSSTKWVTVRRRKLSPSPN